MLIYRQDKKASRALGSYFRGFRLVFEAAGEELTQSEQPEGQKCDQHQNHAQGHPVLKTFIKTS